MSLSSIPSAKIYIDDNIFDKNTGAFSIFEDRYKLPFYEILTTRKKKINFYVNNVYYHQNKGSCTTSAEDGDKEGRDWYENYKATNKEMCELGCNISKKCKAYEFFKD